MALGAQGVVGQITELTPTSASILMASDPTQYIPVKSARNGVQAISQGLAENQYRLRLNFVDPDLDIKTGDLFLTSSLGGKFPDGYPVGRVIHVEQHKDESFLHVILAPIQQISDLEFVIILEDRKSVV